MASFSAKPLLLLLFLSSLVNAQTINNRWKGITPLHSTRSEMEKLLGSPMEGNLNLYDTEKERVAVWYASGTCEGKSADVWKVPKDTVVGFLVSQKDSVPYSTFRNQWAETLEKFPVLGFKERSLYYSKDRSMEIETQISEEGVEEIIFTAYRPAERDNGLRCSAKNGPK